MNWEKLTTDLDKVVYNLRAHLRNYITDHGLKSLVIGVSGGADSALVCALAEPVCKEFNIPLIGRSLPASSNKIEELARASLVGEAFCTDFKEVSIENLFETLDTHIEISEGSLKDPHRNNIRRGNLKARIRMIQLYNIAYQSNGVVLGTDNLTELLLGFWTLHGDVGDLGLIQNLWKTEVYALMEHLRTKHALMDKQKKALQICEEAVPTDGLGVSNSDLDQLGAKTYAEVDQILQEWLYAKENNLWLIMEELRKHPVVQRHERSHFKRNNPYNIPREKSMYWESL